MISIAIFTEAKNFGGGERALSLELSYINKEKFDVTFLCTSNLINSPSFQSVCSNIDNWINIDDFLITVSKTNEGVLHNFRYGSLPLLIQRSLLYRDLLSPYPK